MLIDMFIYLMNQFAHSLSYDSLTVHVYFVHEHYVPRWYMYLLMTAYCLRFEIRDLSSAIGPLGHFIFADLQSRAREILKNESVQPMTSSPN